MTEPAAAAAAEGGAAARAATRTTPEASALWWREGASERTLRRDGRRWTAWSFWVVVALHAPGALLIWLEPLDVPGGDDLLRARDRDPVASGRARGALGGADRKRAQRRARPAPPTRPPSGSRSGCSATCVGHEQRELVAATGCVVERGALGAWVLGEQGAILVRPGGRRVFCWCVRIGDAEGLPAADRVAHLLLALREDEADFATVANLGFSGATWRVRVRSDERQKQALDAAVAAARAG